MSSLVERVLVVLAIGVVTCIDFFLYVTPQIICIK